MRTLRKTLKNRFHNAEKIAVLGIGSDLRADDVSGMLAARSLKDKLSKRKARVPVKIFFGETAPENLTGEIKKFKPSHLIMIDTIDAGKRAGSIYLFKPEDVGGGASFSTHKMPAKILIDYLVNSCGCQATVIGIQPKRIDFGKAVSKSVETAAEKVAVILAETIA
ncbi:MAG: hydrogenase maturation protease [Candidatus Omnitrophica bacterium]|nr:hydrogenase maturation protease [Candidatus Omnitrophota bacterium]